MGPLANPAGVRRQLIGIARPDYVPIYAEALREIGTDRAMVISGEAGLDELSLAGGNAIAEIERDVMRSYIVSAADVGLPVYTVRAIKGGNPAHHATELRKLLLGENGPYRDAVLLNSAAALVIAGEVAGTSDGVAEAPEAMEKGLE